MDEEPKRRCSPNPMIRLRACCMTQRPSGFVAQAMYSICRFASATKTST